MGEVTHTDKGNGVQMSFYTSLSHLGSSYVCPLGLRLCAPDLTGGLTDFRLKVSCRLISILFVRGIAYAEFLIGGAT